MFDTLLPKVFAMISVLKVKLNCVLVVALKIIKRHRVGNIPKWRQSMNRDGVQTPADISNQIENDNLSTKNGHFTEPICCIELLNNKWNSWVRHHKRTFFEPLFIVSFIELYRFYRFEGPVLFLWRVDKWIIDYRSKTRTSINWLPQEFDGVGTHFYKSVSKITVVVKQMKEIYWSRLGYWFSKSPHVCNPIYANSSIMVVYLLGT